MSVTALTPNPPALEILDSRLHVHDLLLEGTIVELVEELGHSEDPDAMDQLLRQAVEAGSAMLMHGHRSATIDAITGQIERLMDTTEEATEKLPDAVQEQLREHLGALATALDERFDGTRTTSVQHQISELVKGATSQQVRGLLAELLGEGGALAQQNSQTQAQLALIARNGADVVAKVTSLVEKLEQKQQLADQLERSSHKGRPFEERVEAELNALHGRLGDDVRCVKDETGLVPGSEAGDHLVIVNRAQTGGLEARIVVEEKTGKLSGPKAQAALKEAIANRGAHAGILVFDGVEDAPLNGRRYMAYPDGRICVVLDDEYGALAFEIACVQARLVALAAVSADGTIDPKWLGAQCDRITQVIEKAVDIKRGSAAARRGLDKVDGAYEELRADALRLLDEVRERLAARC